MLGLSDARHFRRLVAGFCLIAAPVTLLAGALVHPQGKDAAAAQVAVVADNPDRYYAAHAIILAGIALFLPGILGLMHLLRERATALGHVGGGLAMIGLFGATAVVAVDGIAVSQMGQPSANAEEMAALLDRIKESAGLRAIAIAGAVPFVLGMLLLASGLWRTDAVRPWMAGAIAAAAIVFLIGQVTDNRSIFAGAFAIYLVGLGPLGWRILTDSDEEWAGKATKPAVPLAPTSRA
ncbi:MAG: hypothetical protein M3377_00400 [Actinomycetota bacterium]|nr:hypothetical protein [Actinomycetota bacterium]